MQLKYVARDASRWLRRATGTFGKASGRLDRQRAGKPVPLRHEHIASAKMFASRYDYMASLPQGGIVTEVGVQGGNFSNFILETVKPQQLHLIDLSFAKTRGRFAGNPAVVLHEGDSVQVLSRFADAFFDWIYIDADHTYEAVRSDADIAARKVKPGGLLIFNDYIIWAHHEGFAYGVVQAVNELCVHEGWEMVAFCLDSEMSCDVALRRRT